MLFLMLFFREFGALGFFSWGHYFICAVEGHVGLLILHGSWL